MDTDIITSVRIFVGEIEIPSNYKDGQTNL